MPETQPLVSILIAAYKPRFFAECLESAMSQTWQNFEIIVADDGPGPEIEEMTRAYAAQEPRISYYRNPRNLGCRQTFLDLYGKAQGEYIKFLCDDDRLHPYCLSRMVACLQAYPDVTLVTSHRRFIDSEGKEAPELGKARRLCAEDCRADGPAVVNRMIRTHVNFIGEPTTGMFRKRDLADVAPDIFSFLGEQLVTNVDVAMWVNLLSKGNAIFLTEPMSDFRHHPDQEQLNEFTRREAPKVWYSLAMSTGIAGLLRPDRNLDVPVAPLGSIRPWWPAAAQEAVRRAETILETGEIDEAVNLLEQARRAAPGEAWISVLIGGVRLVIGDALGALKEYRTALAFAPEHPRILTNLASALAAMGTSTDLDTAAQLAVNAARLCPDDPDARGLMLQLLGTDRLGAAPAASPPPG